MKSLEELLKTAQVKNQCDVDLLLFFIRHPDSLITSDQLATFVGYNLTQIAKSLDALVERKLLRRSQNRTHAARLYRFRTDHETPWFDDFVTLVSTVAGRRAIRRQLRQRHTRLKKAPPDNHLSSVPQAKEKKAHD